jgi:hypothetical protein
MSTSYLATDSLVQGRQLKVLTLAIPFVVVGSATAANVSLTNDEPALLFFKSESVDQITAALATNETATYSESPSDSGGVVNILLNVGENVEKVQVAHVTSRLAAVETFQACQLGSSTGITTGTGGGKKIMLTMDSTVAFNAANTLDACLEVSYTVAE